jgi:hypothetical protein
VREGSADDQLGPRTRGPTELVVPAETAARIQRQVIPGFFSFMGFGAGVRTFRTVVLDGARGTSDAGRPVRERAFLRVFPDVPSSEGDDGAAPASARELEDLLTVLATIAEVVGALGGEVLERKADAVEILERLLADAGLPPWRYEALVAAPTRTTAAAVRAVHAALRA